MITTLSGLGATLLLGIPAAIAILAASLVYFITEPIPDQLAAQRFLASIESFPLLAIPFFVLAGVAMAQGGIATRILGLAYVLLGRARGGLAQVNVVNSVLMGGMSGSANADAAIDAKVLVPIMRQHGYERGFSTALSAASGLLAPLLPPSIGMIVYGLATEVSIGKLFAGGIVPGLLVAIALGIAVWLISHRRGYGTIRDSRPHLKDIAEAVWAAKWALSMPVLILLGLRAGVFTPTELGAIVAVYSIAVGMFAHKEIRVRDLLPILKEAVLATTAVMLIIGAAGALGAVLTQERIPQLASRFLLSLTDDPTVAIVLVCLLLLALGLIFESVSVLVLAAPVLAPIAVELGIDPIHFGVIVVFCVAVGGITPPIGTVMFTVTAITGSPTGEYSRAIVPFLIAVLVVLAILVMVPWLITGPAELLVGS